MSVTTSILNSIPKWTLSGNDCWLRIKATNTDTNTFTNVKIHLVVKDLQSNTVDHQVSIINTANQASFNIKDAFYAQHQIDFAFPEHQSNLFVTRNKMVFRYQVQFYASYQNNGVYEEESTNNTDWLYNFYGGLSEQDFLALRTINSNWQTWLLANKKFLNNYPGTKTTSMHSMEKLYWIGRSSGDENYYIPTRIKFTYTTTAGEAKTYITDTENIYEDYVYECCVSANILAQLTGDAIASYTVVLINSSNQEISEKRTYTVSQKQGYNFIFLTSAGGYDTLFAHGSYTENASLKHEYLNQELRQTATAQSFSTLQRKALNTRIGKANSGFLTQPQKDAALELLQSEKIYLYDGNSIFPVVGTTDKEVLLRNPNFEPHSLTFEFEYSHKSRFYSNLAVALEFILPPYFNLLRGGYYYMPDNFIRDVKGGYAITIDGTNLDFSTITKINGVTQFDFSDTNNWDVSIQSEPWYDSNNTEVCPITFFTAESLAKFATPQTHARLFFRDNTGNITDSLPILVYNENLTEAQQTVVGKWLEWYYFILDGQGNLTTEDGEYITENY